MLSRLEKARHLYLLLYEVFQPKVKILCPLFYRITEYPEFMQKVLNA